MNSEPNWVHKFRIYALKLLYIPYVLAFCLLYNNYVVTEKEDTKFSYIQTLWLWSFRLSSLALLPGLYPMAITFLRYNAPPLNDHQVSRPQGKPTYVPALILRIVTMGNYKNMIENSIIYHEKLIRKYLHCDYFRIHVLTEKELNLEKSYPKIVKEIIVPKTYQPISGSIGKARNLAYWAQTQKLGDELNEQKTWIIDMDEDVILSESFMKAFSNDFLKDQTYPKIGLPQAIINLKKSDGFVTTVTQACRFSIDLGHHWPRLHLHKKPPVLCHGGCFVARADCSIDKSAESGPFCSMSEDNAYTMSMVSKKIPLQLIDGWFLEDAPTSVMGNIYQKVRWQKGHTYLLMYLEVPWRQKMDLAVWLLGTYFVLPLCALTRLFAVGIVIGGKASNFFPAGQAIECGIIDLLTAISVATFAYAFFYGFWFVLPWRRAAVYSLLVFTLVPLVVLHAIDLAVIILASMGLVKEIVTQKTTFITTVKTDKE